MSRRFSLILCILGMTFPLFAYAKQTTTWDFVKNNAGQWSVQGLDQVEVQSSGLHIGTAHDGAILRALDTPRTLDILRVDFAKTPPDRIDVLWRVNDAKTEGFHQLALSTPMAWVDGNTVIVDLSVAPVHIGDCAVIGFAFPAGTQATIQRITATTYAWPEKLWEGWKSFWISDNFSARTINFLWGPILRFTSEGRGTLFQYAPPLGWSANVVFYALLFLVGLASILWCIFHRDKHAFHRGALAFFSFALCLWIFYDVRMGTELLRNVESEVHSYFLQPVGSRQFGSFGNFYPSLLSSVPSLKQKPRFVAIAPPETMSRILYETYPSRPLQNGESIEGVTTWFIYQQPDITVDDKGELRSGTTVLAKGGHILQRFDASSFLYQTL